MGFRVIWNLIIEHEPRSGDGTERHLPRLVIWAIVGLATVGVAAVFMWRAIGGG